MRKVKGEWVIRSVNELLGWEVTVSDAHSIDEVTGIARVTIRNKTTNETREVNCPIYLVPVSSLEYKRGNGE